MILSSALLSVASGRFALGTVLVARGLEVTSFVLVRVTSWIVLVFLDNGMIHEITRTKHEQLVTDCSSVFLTEPAPLTSSTTPLLHLA